MMEKKGKTLIVNTRLTRQDDFDGYTKMVFINSKENFLTREATEDEESIIWLYANQNGLVSWKEQKKYNSVSDIIDMINDYKELEVRGYLLTKEGKNLLLKNK